MIEKRSPYINKKMRNASAGRACVRCGNNDGTTVRAHYTGFRQHQLGKGTGQKCDDHCSADLCHACHEYFDVGIDRKSVLKSEEFLFLCMLTLRRDLDEGVIK